MANGFGRYDVYTTAGSVYCYKDTNVLRNRFGLRDGAQLKQIETDISMVRQNDLLQQGVNGRFSVTHLCRIHRYLFADIYPFAGHFRREDIMKGMTRFLSHREVKSKLAALLAELREEEYLKDLPFGEFVKRSAYYFAELNYIHPFREGNGRAIREFMRQLFLENGYIVRWNRVEADALLHAMEASVFELEELCTVLECCLEKRITIDQKQKS